jgi:hypothetical protein
VSSYLLPVCIVIQSSPQQLLALVSVDIVLVTNADKRTACFIFTSKYAGVRYHAQLHKPLPELCTSSIHTV